MGKVRCCPPSTTKIVPVINFAASLAKNNEALAISYFFPKAFTGKTSFNETEFYFEEDRREKP